MFEALLTILGIAVAMTPVILAIRPVPQTDPYYA